MKYTSRGTNQIVPATYPDPSDFLQDVSNSDIAKEMEPNDVTLSGEPVVKIEVEPVNMVEDDTQQKL